MDKPGIIRTLGFVRAHDEEAILAAADSGIDALGPDLEDLTPRAEKQRARSIFRDMAKELVSRGVIVSARTNAIGEGCEEDLEAIVCPELHFVNMPKATSAEQVKEFCRLLEKAERNNGIPVGTILVRPVIETATGIRCAYEIAAAAERVTYMGGVAGGFWGDLGGTLGSIHGPDGAESHYIRAKVLVDVRSAGVRFPIGGGSTSRSDPDGVREFALQNKRLGYTGHFVGPNRSVVSIVNEVYTPTSNEIQEWQAVLPRLEKAQQDGEITFLLNGKMYDTAGLQRVRDLLALAVRLKLVA